MSLRQSISRPRDLLIFSMFFVTGLNCTGILHAQRVPVSGDGRKVEIRHAGTTVVVPRDYSVPIPRLLEFPEKEYTIRLFSGEFSQGDVVYAEILPPDGVQASGLRASLFFDGKQVPMVSRSFGERGIFAIDRFMKPGKQKVTIEYQIAGQNRKRTYRIGIHERKFPVSKTVLQLGSYSDRETYEDPEIKRKIEYSSARREQAFATVGEDMLNEVISHPRNIHFITSEYYTKRIKEQFRMEKEKKIPLKPLIRYHLGIDFRGVVGDPVYAMARGKVLLSENLFFEGNVVVIDHGNGIQSAYMHLNSLKVKEGETVNAGQPIATVGQTGAVTGPHLHVSLYINKSSVDPMSLLTLPIRN